MFGIPLHINCHGLFLPSLRFEDVMMKDEGVSGWIQKEQASLPARCRGPCAFAQVALL